MVIQVAETRSQARNREIVRDRLADLIRRALVAPKRRIATKPTLGAKKRRLKAIPGLPPVVDKLPEGCAFADRCDRAQVDCRAEDIPLARNGGHAVRCLHPVSEAREVPK